MSAESSLPRSVVRASVASIEALAANPSRQAQARDSLTAVERERFARFRQDDDRWMFALGRLMAREMVGAVLGIGPHEWQWREGRHGRPEIAAPPTDLHFNLSHSAGLVVCAVGRGRELGVDVEHVDRRPPDPAIIDRYLSPVEAADARAHGGAWVDRFLLYWTLKEAYLKARGLGISVPLVDITFRATEDSATIGFGGVLTGTDDRWQFAWRRLGTSHLVALAASVSDGPVTFELDWMAG